MIDLDHFGSRYLAGEPVDKLAPEAGGRPVWFYGLMKRNGFVRPRQPGKKRIILVDADSIASRYSAGESELSLSRSAGVSRAVIRRHLVEKCVPLRNQSESESVKWSRMTEAQRRSQVAPAHIAARGRVVTATEKSRRSSTHERTGSRSSPLEQRFVELLAVSGVAFTQQKSVGPYNLDFAVKELPIAVEIFGGNWHASGRHLASHPERCKYLLDNGWSIIIIWVDSRTDPLTVKAAEYVAAFVEQSRRDPSLVSQYRVILGGGQDAPVRKSYLNTRSIIERFGRRDD